MIPSEWIEGDYRCPKCDRNRKSVDINHYNKDGVDHTAIKLTCMKCGVFIGTVNIYELVKGAEKKSEQKRTRKKMGVGIGSLEEPE